MYIHNQWGYVVQYTHWNIFNNNDGIVFSDVGRSYRPLCVPMLESYVLFWHFTGNRGQSVSDRPRIYLYTV